jgi:hypothetical protein
LVLVSLFTAWALYGVSAPGGPNLSFACFSFLALPVIGVDYVARMMASFADRQRAQSDLVPAHSAKRRGWAVTPLCIVILASAWTTAWPLRLRFAVSKPAFESKVLALQGGKDTHMSAQWIGLYRVQRIELLDPDVICFETVTIWGDRLGFAFDPHRRLPLDEYVVAHPTLEAPWTLYVWLW